MTKYLLSLAALLLASCTATAPTAPSITIENAWARETAPGQQTGAVYVTLINRTSRDDQLVGVTTPRAAHAMLHSSSDSGGVMSMRMAPDVALPAGSTVELKPLGTHIMIMGLSAPLKAGERLPLTLRFAGAGERIVDAAVLPAGSSGPAR